MTRASARRALDWTGRILLWLVIFAAAAIVLVTVVVPRVGGATPYAILTGSMRPSLPPGTLVVSRPIDPGKIGVGTVITYQLESGRPTVVTHRVVSQGVDGKGGLLFRTQGDANNTPDQKWVRPVQVRGAQWYAVPYLGYASVALTGGQHRIVVYAIAGALLSYALVMFAGAARDRRRRQVIA